MFWNCYLGENVKKLIKQKIAQNIAIYLGHFIFMINYTELLKGTQWNSMFFIIEGTTEK